MPLGIEDYGLIGDGETAALVGRDGSIDWLCLPNFDSPACFASLLHNPTAGRWLLAPTAGGRCTRRRYHGDTLVLETDFHTALEIEERGQIQMIRQGAAMRAAAAAKAD